MKHALVNDTEIKVGQKSDLMDQTILKICFIRSFSIELQKLC